MSDISAWSPVAASNNAATPDGWPQLEGQNPSTVNDCAREMQAAIRRRFESAEWFGWGHVLVRQSANSFLVSSTATQIYTAGRRIKLYDTTTIYGDVIASSPSGANTLVTVSSSALTASLSSGEVGIINPQFRSLPDEAVISLGTEVASTAGTSIDFTGIPPRVKRITINFAGVSGSGTSPIMFQLGDSGGVEATGYLSASTALSSGPTVNSANGTTGFRISGANIVASNVFHGSIVFTLEDSANNVWNAIGIFAASDGAANYLVAGQKPLSATLDRVRITTVGGTDTFDAGAINIAYE